MAFLGESLKHTLKAFGLFLASTLFDAWTSLRIKWPDFEGNGFARHENGLFWPRHYAIINGICGVEALVESLVIYYIARPLGPKVAQVLACVPWLYYSWVHVDAAFSNIAMQWPGLYVETAGQILNRLLGQ